MSDEPKPEETPPPETPAASPADAQPAAQAPASPTPQTPSLKPSPGPIDYALPAPKKSWLPTPQMIRNIGCLMKLIVGFTVLIILGYLALVALNPKARQWALQGTKAGPGGTPPSGKGPTPFKALNQVLAIPAQAMGKTDDVVKANNARVGQLDGVIKEEEGKAKGGSGGRSNKPVVDPFANPSPVGGTSRPDKSASETDTGPQAVSSAALLALAEKRGALPEVAEQTSGQIPAGQQAGTGRAAPAAPETPNEMKLPGDIVIAQASPAGAPRASAAFFYSIVKLNISGITQGKPARALINNRLAYEGDEINRQLGIVFAQLDTTNKLLVFKDSTGATVTRSY
jgi:hypothetical protein